MTTVRKPQRDLGVGDHVVFASAYLRDTGQIYADGPAGFRGTIIDVEKLHGNIALVTVDWGTHTGKVLNSNLWPEKKKHLEPH